MSKLLFSSTRRYFYRIAVEPTLLGPVCVTRIYGRCGGKQKSMTPIQCKNKDQALRQAQRLICERIKRGYDEQTSDNSR